MGVKGGLRLRLNAMLNSKSREYRARDRSNTQSYIERTASIDNINH
jgi:hypothetical protein